MDERQQPVVVIHNENSAYPTIDYAPAKTSRDSERSTNSNQPQHVCEMIGLALALLGLDSQRYGTPQWNPLSEIIKPGMKVLLKPNWVREYNLSGAQNILCMYTHPSVIKAVLDYVLKALGRSGEVTIGDAPLQSCDLSKLLWHTRLDSLVGDYRNKGFNVNIRDFRLRVQHPRPSGDPTGYTLVDLGTDSFHSSRDYLADRYRVASYNPKDMKSHHGAGKHEYLICNTALDADVIISLPKLKTHKKSGVTGALKNFIGTVGRKEFLPHHTKGYPQAGGDEYSRKSLLKALHGELIDILFGDLSQRFRIIGFLSHLGVSLSRSALSPFDREVIDGSWEGNDTLWRTILDVTRILQYYDRSHSSMSNSRQREILTIVDGIVAGEGDGPLAPTSRNAGVIIAGADLVATDATIAKLIGIDIRRIPSIVKATGLRRWPLTLIDDFDGIRLKSLSNGEYKEFLLPELPSLKFVLPLGWQQQTEIA
ncbi:MAG: DUF362 domain-containing protein [Syntrophorhabdales bacterium]|jgi:uncharacterized protein (DUF362 family)